MNTEQRLNVLILSSLLSLAACAVPAGDAIQVLPAADVNWEQLNPARGDLSPRAATLWGDRKADVPTGFLVQFVDGFSSPPHIHNVSYRGVVISGLIHNDDPGAANLWMPSGSYWTQPAGEAHITSAKGADEANIAFIEIDSGPYLVRPQEQAFDNGERPFNMHAKNVIWQADRSVPSVELAPLWQDARGQVTGTLIRFSQRLRVEANRARLVLIQGSAGLPNSAASLAPGSLLTLAGSAVVELECQSDTACVAYLKSADDFELL